ncbi:extracellular solute-binding protein [Paenibacillus sp. PAMC21692]|uniref:extracellular solute-binding protein n=1 Tax=Paenibacillus sp. PAMC21692 TaxID=2762320 RepID=UPI00164D1071|nr:extracellular solute-binding protein [Paenibacillus sp. PAMC21692]QNK57071.1 extracellular solute-binding protein [Paenibacillus sp. PAMC21692]
MKRNKAIATVLLCLVLTACSTGGNNPSKPSTGDQPSASNSPSASETSGNGDNARRQKFTINAIDFRNPAAIPPATGRGLDMINEKFNIDYKPQFVVINDYMQKLSANVASGEVPDIMTMEGPIANFYKWAKQGAFLPLNDYIDKYPTLKLVPDYVWKSMTLDGQIYAIPRYFPSSYLGSPIIRKDWLDKLGLKAPTNYEELKEVAIAFTKNDPDGNNKDDTYGMAISEYVNPAYELGGYWEFRSWYHQDEEGNYIPNFISDTRKEHVAWLADLEKEGALTPNSAVVNATQATNDFFSGKAGIWISSPRGMDEAAFNELLKINPNAKIEPIEPFVAPDGEQGFMAYKAYYGMTMLSAELADDPDKLHRVLEFLDFGRTFYPLDERNKSNPDYDWMYGNEGTGYTVEDGTAKAESAEKGLAPINFYIDGLMWAPSDDANEYSRTYKSPAAKELAQKLEEMHKNTKHFINPIYQIFSDTYISKGSELDMFLYEEQTKMIFGQRPISDWDKMVQEWRDKGGAQMIKEVNEAMKANGVKGEYK